jgi:hypothetical protein
MTDSCPCCLVPQKVYLEEARTPKRKTIALVGKCERCGAVVVYDTTYEDWWSNGPAWTFHGLEVVT